MCTWLMTGTPGITKRYMDVHCSTRTCMLAHRCELRIVMHGLARQRMDTRAEAVGIGF